jgi:hypothetical protein
MLIFNKNSLFINFNFLFLSLTQLPLELLICKVILFMIYLIDMSFK